MRFLADMGVSLLTVKWLRSMGHDATHLTEQGLFRLSDGEVLSKASSEQRIILTMDLDFGYLLAVSGESVPSVIILRLEDECSENVQTRLRDVLNQFAEALQSGAVVSVNERSIRVRRLPIRMI